MRSLEFWNEDNIIYDLEETPVDTVRDMPQHANELLDHYDKENRLTWHNSTIPEDEVWLLTWCFEPSQPLGTISGLKETFRN